MADIGIAGAISHYTQGNAMEQILSGRGFVSRQISPCLYQLEHGG
jgi:hypothetical protein